MLALLSTAGVVAAALVWRGRRPFARRPSRTVVDVRDCADAERLVRALDRGDGADGLASRMTRVFDAFPPDEPAMRVLSLLHQRHAHEGGPRNYCTTLVYAVATDACNRCRRHAAGAPPAARAPRTHGVGTIQRVVAPPASRSHSW